MELRNERASSRANQALAVIQTLMLEPATSCLRNFIAAIRALKRRKGLFNIFSLDFT